MHRWEGIRLKMLGRVLNDWIGWLRQGIEIGGKYPILLKKIQKHLIFARFT
jgi:hypothetical protein